MKLHHILVGLGSVSLATAGQVVSYVCTQGTGNSQVMALRVHYNNAQDGCNGLNSYDAKSGIISTFEGTKKFCGNDGFCAKVEVSLFHSSRNGLHVMLKGHDVDLGKASTTENLDPNSVGAKTICGEADMKAGKITGLSVNIWNNVGRTACG